MTGNKLTLKLTAEQQKQIKDATGRAPTELQLSWATGDEISEAELANVIGGASDAPSESLSLNFTKIEIASKTL
jgi:bacteriocin-like protein